MKISELLDLLRAQKTLKRTLCGRIITDYGENAIDATLEDTKNYGAEAVKCLNCCIILSGLITPEGCPNCGSKDLTRKIMKADIL